MKSCTKYAQYLNIKSRAKNIKTETSSTEKRISNVGTKYT